MLCNPLKKLGDERKMGVFSQPDVLRLCEGGEIEEQMFKLAQMFNRIPNVQISTEAPLLQNRC